MLMDRCSQIDTIICQAVYFEAIIPAVSDSDCANMSAFLITLQGGVCETSRCIHVSMSCRHGGCR